MYQCHRNSTTNNFSTDASGAHRLAAHSKSLILSRNSNAVRRAIPPQTPLRKNSLTTTHPANLPDFTGARLSSLIINQSHSMAIDTALPDMIERDLRHKKPGISFTETWQMRIMSSTAKMIC